MAGQDHLLSTLTTLLAGFDDASWEKLASKGLLRRARKDLEGGLAVALAGESGDLLQLDVPPFKVSIPASGPAKATCSCPAPGICQHILAAGIFLQSSLPGEAAERPAISADSIRQEITSIHEDALRKWAGAAEYRAGLTLLEKNSNTPTITYGESVSIRLMPSTVEARYIVGGGLDGMILPKSNSKRIAVAAILALRASLGLAASASVVQPALFEVSGTPRTRSEILTSACSALEHAVFVGLSHSSPVIVERLRTLAVSATGAGLYRVSLSMKSIAEELVCINERDARADESRLLLAMARAYALMDAIRSGGQAPRTELTGTARALYVEVPELELNGVGAYTWKTGSGYAGLTLLFWSDSTQEFLSWSEARPAAQRFDPRQRFFADGPWDGVQSPQQASSARLRLRNVRRSGAGRLSSSRKTNALVLGRTNPREMNFGDRYFQVWREVRAYAHRMQPLGLRESSPLDSVVVLTPTVFGQRSFDSIAQILSWEIHDTAGEPLTLTLPFRDWSKEAIAALEKLEPVGETDWRVLVRLLMREGRLEAEPISILKPSDLDAPVFHLAFDAVRSPAAPAIAHVALDEDQISLESDEEEEESERSVSIRSGSYSARVLDALNRNLESIAECGCEVGLTVHWEWIQRQRQQLRVNGLAALVPAFDALGTSRDGARALLRARYITHIHGQIAV